MPNTPKSPLFRPIFRIKDGPLLTAEEVADHLGVTRDYVWKLAREGSIPTVRLGERRLRFRAEAIDRWVEEDLER